MWIVERADFNRDPNDYRTLTIISKINNKDIFYISTNDGSWECNIETGQSKIVNIEFECLNEIKALRDGLTKILEYCNN